MTLVPQKESGNTKVKSLDDRRVYEVIGGLVRVRRSLHRRRLPTSRGEWWCAAAKSLKISGGPAARVTVRWRFGRVASATVNGVAVQVQAGADGASVEFDYAAVSLVEWQ